VLLRRTGCDFLIMHGIHRDARLDAERGRALAHLRHLGGG
jgi:hypothetical protein